MNIPIDPYAVPDDQVKPYLAVKKMIAILAKARPPDFFVGLARYFVDGEEYRASGLTVSPSATPNLVQTQTGFACNAFFSPELLTPKAKKGKAVIDGLLQVRLEVRLGDIWLIKATAEADSSKELILFEGPPRFDFLSP